MSISRSRILAPLFALSIAAAGAVAPASPAFAATWSVVPTPNASSGQNLFIGIDALSTTDVWAVGRADHAPEQPFRRPLAAHWDGSDWTLVGTPTLAGQLSGVDGAAPDDVWGVGARQVPLGGGSYTLGPLAERWDGSSWSVVSTPTPSGATGAALSGVKAFSATDVWAVGDYSASGAPNDRTLIQHWDGTSWSTVPSPNPDPNRNLLSDIDGASPQDVWAIGNMGADGYGGTVAGLVLHWDGSSWSQVNVPGTVTDATFSSPNLRDVFALAADDVWIVGAAFHRTMFKVVPYALHWDGVSWQRSFVANAPNDGRGFSGVAALSPTQVYGVGSVIANWNGTGWSLESVTVPGVLSDAAATGASTVWGLGYQYDPNLAQLRTLAMRTTDG